MTWAELHTESERLAIEAQLALRARGTEQAIELYRQAAEIEQRALERSTYQRLGRGLLLLVLWLFGLRLVCMSARSNLHI